MDKQICPACEEEVDGPVIVDRVHSNSMGGPPIEPEPIYGCPECGHACSMECRGDHPEEVRLKGLD